MQQFIDKVIPFIIAQQEAEGSFSTWESYPVVNPAAGWTKLPDSSPFITANILFALIQVGDPRLKEVIEKGAQNLLASKEGTGFWRFWPVKSKQHPLPLDMDDTCIVSAVLERCGYTFDNQRVLLNNQNSDGYFETWLQPKLDMLLTSPGVLFAFVHDYLLARSTHRLKYFAYNDKEPAIAANALLYLGENDQTKVCIGQIVNEVKSGNLSRKFYDDEVVIFYHISRAYTNSIPGFDELGEVVTDKIFDRFEKNTGNETDLMLAMAANILLCYNLKIDLAQKLIQTISERNSYPGKWTTDAYFCSNDKNFLAGSPALTAAVFIEACAKLNRVKKA